MAINKKLIHFDLFSDFSSKKLSANKENTKYTLGVDGAVTNGSPDILWHSICWIKDESKMWTHGKLYDCSPFVNSIEGKINLSSITEIKAAQSKLTQTNEVAYYLITDRSGRLPSTEACYDIPSDCVKQLSMRSPDTLSNSALTLATSAKDVSPIGVNVGDLIAITRVKVGVSDLASAIGITLNLGSEVEIYQYKVLPTNDVKAPDTQGTEVGVMGLASPWDKQQINKIPSIESNLSTKASELNRGNKKQVFDADNYNIDRCLNAGIYKYGRTGRSMPDNHSDEYYIVDVDTRYNRSDSLYYVTQKVYSVNYPNRAFERLITTTSIDNYNGTYSDWVQIGKDSYTRNEIETNYATKTYVGEQISGLVGNAPDALDTIYELSAALKDNKDIVDVLEEAITNKADKSSIPTNVSQLTNDSGYITSVAKGTATTQATSQTLMCDVNINGKTVTPVKFNGTVGSSTMPVYMAGGKPTPITSFGGYTPDDIKTMETNLEDVISDVVSIDTSLFPTSTDEVIGFRQTNGGDGVGYSEAWLDRLKGNAVVWNQVVNISNVIAQYDKTLYTITRSDGLIEVSKSEGGSTSSDAIFVYYDHNFIASRRYLIVYNLKRFDGQNTGHRLNSNGIYDGSKYHDLIDVNGTDYKFFSPTESFTSTQMQIAQTVTVGVALSYTLRPVIYDLTQMFGAGNEPTTIEEFNARKPLGVTDAYNEGELISTTADELKSVGFNAWDEEWENGLLTSSGDMVYPSAIRSKNYIEVIPQATYIFGCPNKTGNGIAFYDTEKKIIGKLVPTEPNTAFTTPAECRYMRFDVSSSYGNTYNHDICIHLVHTGTRNGQYEPYKEYRLPLPIKDIKDKDGNQLFPNGLLSAGTAYDEITATKAIKRIGVVDMGTLTWNMDDTYESFNLVSNVRNYGFRAAFNSATKANLTNPIYPVSTIGGSDKNTDKTIKLYDVAGLRVKDTSYTSAATFKAAMSGVMLYYELAEPIEVDIEEWDRRYEVSDFGTEEVISDTPTTPLKADIIYEYNAKGRIEANERGIEELNDKIAEINEKVGEMNGLSISSDKIWSEENPVDITLGDVDNDAFLPEGYGLAGGQSRVARMYVKFTSTATTYEGEFMSSYNDNCLIIGAKGYYQLEAPNGTMLKRGYLGDSFVKVEQIGNSGWKFDFAALDMEEGMKVHVGAMLDCIDID